MTKLWFNSYRLVENCSILAQSYFGQSNNPFSYYATAIRALRKHAFIKRIIEKGFMAPLNSLLASSLYNKCLSAVK